MKWVIKENIFSWGGKMKGEKIAHLEVIIIYAKLQIYLIEFLLQWYIVYYAIHISVLNS